MDQQILIRMRLRFFRLWRRNGLAGRTFHFDEMYISETEDEGEYFSFEFLGERNGHYYYVSQQLMSWHDGLNFTDTVDVGEDISIWLPLLLLMKMILLVKH